MNIRYRHPEDVNNAIALLPNHDCASPEFESPKQAAMWLKPLADPHNGVAISPSIRWMEGRPTEQEVVCIPQSEANQFPHGLKSVPVLPDGWLVYWPPRRMGRDDVEPHRNLLGLHVTARSASLEVWAQGDSIAVYRIDTDQHAWLANFEEAGPSGGWKIDRWPRLHEVLIQEDRQVAVQVTMNGDGDRQVFLLPIQ